MSTFSDMWDIIDNFEQVLEAKRKAAEMEPEAIGIAAEANVKRICPWRTGKLCNSISHTIKKNDVWIGTNVEYAPAIELGTYTTAAHPYLKPAVTEHTDEYKQIIQRYFIATIGTTALLTEVNWIAVASVSALAGVLSLLTSLAGLPEVSEG